MHCNADRRCVCPLLYSCVVCCVCELYAVCAWSVLNVISCAWKWSTGVGWLLTCALIVINLMLSSFGQVTVTLMPVMFSPHLHVCLLVFKLSCVQSLKVWSLVECDESVTWFCTPISATLRLVAAQLSTGDPGRAVRGCWVPPCSGFGPRYNTNSNTNL